MRRSLAAILILWALPLFGANSDGRAVAQSRLNILLDSLRAGTLATTGSAGDANGDGLVSVADIFYLINFLFAGGPPPVSLAAGDLSGEVTGPTSATVVSNAVATNTANAIVRRDASGNFSAGTVTLAGALALPATASSSVGVITVGGNPFAHSFGAANTFLGTNAGNFTMAGNSNTAVGNTALLNNSGGSRNTAGGVGALFSHTTGDSNTAVGAGALASDSTSFGNTAIGDQALFSSTGGYNTAIGFNALMNDTSGGGNIAIGQNAGLSLTTGNNNIDIGNAGVAGESGTIRIGTGGGQGRAFIEGIYNVTASGGVPVLINSNGQLGTSSSSRRFKFDIADMVNTTEGLMRLRPVTFRYLAQGPDGALQYGLIAEEVAEVYPELVTRNKDGEVEAVMYQFLAPMLLNEVQKQRKIIETLEQRLQAVEKQLAKNRR